MAIHVLYGPEEYRRQRALTKLREASVSEALGALGQHHLDQPGIQALCEQLQTATLALGGLPYYEITHFSPLMKSPGAEKAKAIEALIEVLAMQATQKTIVFVSEGFDRKLKLPKWLSKAEAVHVQSFDIPPFWKGNEAAQSLQQEAQTLGIRLDFPAATLLCEHLGHALRPLITECERLHAYTRGQTVTRDIIQRLSVLDDDAFTLIDHWLQGRLSPKALAKLPELFRRTHPLQFLALLQRQVAYHHRIKSAQTVGHSIEETAKREGKKPYPVQKDLEKLRHVPLSRLTQRRQDILTQEHAIKRGDIEATQAIDLLLMA